MTTAEVREFYEQLLACGFKLVIIVGGEPLLREDLPEAMAVLTGRAYSTVFTNGLLLAERPDLLRNANNVFISLDAPDEEHDNLRARKGCFERAVNGIEMLRSRYPGIAPAIMTTVTGANAHRVGDMIRLSREMRLPIGFQPPTYSGLFGFEGRPQGEGEKMAPRQEILTEAFRIIREAARRERIFGSTAFFDHVIHDVRTYPCQYPYYVLGPVYPNGDVIACTTSQVIGNINNRNVKQFLAGHAFQRNADAGPTCPTGCRDWGIYDISAVHNRTHSAGDFRRLARGFLFRN
jgi:MoaA/NifB/PqqE/SkfB family radical SAM enzyme